MKNLFMTAVVASFALLLVTACGNNNQEATPSAEQESGTEEEALQVVSSFTIIQDMAREIGGDDVEVYNLVPTGTDPHEYEPLPEDIKKATDADILLYNGLNLEGGKSGWFWKMMDAVGQKEESIFNLSEGVEPMYLSDEDGQEEEVNPHAYIDPNAGIQMSENLRDALIEIDPEKKEQYEQRWSEYVDRLKNIEQEYADKINSIPEDERIIVTSERAFQYFAKRYGLQEAYIWMIDTEENGSPKQIKSLVEFLKEQDVPVLFVESNVDRRPMETVSKEAGVPIYEKPIYSDEIGKQGDEVDTYIKFLQHNIDILHDGLSK